MDAHDHKTQKQENHARADRCLSSDSSFLRSFQNVVLYLNITLINTIVRFYKIFDKKTKEINDNKQTIKAMISVPHKF